MGPYVELLVADTGEGIDQDDLPRLFERFHRVRGARARNHEGSGIGLALVKDLVELHGGTVEVASAPGEGTTFTVRLPLGSAHLPAAQVGPAPPAPPVAGHRQRSAHVDAVVRASGEGASAVRAAQAGLEGRVLVVDDNEDMLAYPSRLRPPDRRTGAPRCCCTCRTSPSACAPSGACSTSPTTTP